MDVNRILETISGSGIIIKRINQVEPELEDVYKKLIGGDDKDDENDEDKNKYSEDSTGYYI